MRKGWIAALGCLTLLTACSSTEQADTTEPAGTEAPTTDAPATDAPTTDAPTTEAPTTDAPTTDAPTTEAPADVPGVDGDTVRIGFITSTNQAAAQEAVGATGITFVPHDQIVDTLLTDLADAGGLAGKTVEPVVYVSDAVVDTDPQANARAICATFTEDNEVYAVVTINEPSTEVLACMNEAGVPVFASSGATFSFSDASVYEANPLFVNSSGISLDRAATALVEGLDTAGFFTPEAQVGIVRLSDPAFDAAATNSLEPALAAAGVEPVSSVALATIKSNDDLGRFSTEAANAVLDMKDAGVTHLVFFEAGGAAPFFFLTNAAGQGFTPQLGFSSLSGGQTLVQNINTGGTNVAWSPIGEVPEADQLPESEAATRCLDLVDSTRAVYTSPNATSETLRFCDATWALQAAVEAAGDTVPATDLIAALEGLGDSYQSPAALRTEFGPGRRDGVSEYYITDYDPSCSCNVYRSGDPTPIG